MHGGVASRWPAAPHLVEGRRTVVGRPGLIPLGLAGRIVAGNGHPAHSHLAVDMVVGQELARAFGDCRFADKLRPAGLEGDNVVGIEREELFGVA